MKTVSHKAGPRGNHWVGNGFPVRNMFGYNDLGQKISPFLLLDYAGPHSFEPSTAPRGVGQHPHRGFETVTIIYSGEVEHRDSAGNSGLIGPGDVQWMTAASGVLHEEMHSPTFMSQGGIFEVIQLWVNLPARHKMSSPGYQTLTSSMIPEFKDKGVVLRVIAGEAFGLTGPAKTFTKINVWDIRMQGASRLRAEVPSGHTAVVFVIAGKIKLCGEELVGPVELAVLSNLETSIEMECLEESKVLFLGGESINEPVVGLGPFVMNSKEEIKKAFEDFG